MQIVSLVVTILVFFAQASCDSTMGKRGKAREEPRSFGQDADISEKQPPVAGSESSETTWTPKLLLAFQGKGTKAAWDAGVMKALFETKLYTDRELIFAGNSSGAILAAAAACRGFNEAGIVFAEEAVKAFKRSMVNEATFEKLPDLIRGKDPSFPHETILPYIEYVTADCDMNTMRPVMIAAGNQDILETTAQGRSVELASLDMVVNNKSIGKICTYFATPKLSEILLKVPAYERQCDVRVINSVADLRLATLASVSEPTYFPPLAEPDASKILTGTVPTLRHYNGGFVAQNLAQDLRRSLPGIKALGSGRPFYSTMESGYLRAKYNIKLNPMLALAKYWYDLEINPNAEDWRVVEDPETSPETAFKLGYEQSTRCLSSNSCLDATFTEPEFKSAIENADLIIETRGGL